MSNPTDKSMMQAIVDDQRPDAEKNGDDAMLRHLQTDLTSALTARDENGQESDWDEYYEDYTCTLSKSKIPWRSSIKDPESYSMVETILPRLLNPLLGGPEVFGVKPTGQDDVAKARKSKHLLDYQADRMSLYARLGDICKDGLIYGTGLGKVRWRKEYEPRVEMQPVLDHQKCEGE